jgi:hypothetical protein
MHNPGRFGAGAFRRLRPWPSRGGRRPRIYFTGSGGLWPPDRGRMGEAQKGNRARNTEQAANGLLPFCYPTAEYQSVLAVTVYEEDSGKA